MRHLDSTLGYLVYQVLEQRYINQNFEFRPENQNIKMSLQSNVSKRWSISRLIIGFIVGFTVFSYVSYIAYEFSKSVMSTYSKSSLTDATDRSGNFQVQFVTTGSPNPNPDERPVQPCSRNSGPCKDIPDYFKGMIHCFQNQKFW